MSNGSDIAAEIATALGDVGRDTGTGSLVATVTRAPEDAATKPWEDASEVDPTAYSLTVIRDSWARGQIDGTLIRATDLKLMAAAGGVVPTVADKLTLSGENYQIVNVWPEAVGGVDLFYIIQARK